MHSVLRRLDLNLLLTFDALYRNRTVTNAASELAISASAFSHALGRLREALNDELFIRQGNRMHPTQRADLLASAVSESLRILSDQLGQWEPFNPATSQRTFVFAATDYTAFALLPGLVDRLQQVAPNLCLRVVYSDRKVSIEDLACGRIDFALGYSEDRDALPAGVDSEDWLTGEYIVIASQQHPRIQGAPDLSRYLAEKHAVITPWGEKRGVVDHVLDGMGLKRKVALQLPAVMIAPFIIAGSELLMTIPRHAAETLRMATTIALYPAPFAIPPYTLKLYSHSKYARSDGHAWMSGQLRALFTEDNRQSKNTLSP
ncbi:LysR family transcriptional regulator [Pseudomonas gingeri]|uniref:LysR family transcriptional regulator n=1 Tax=Pseudomonas gingeri TaxID=117681 RepID=A0A7Y7YG93_9PSED|nr:LysR family transcriptional regulator [Pseudomonas gingeri]NWB31333.1 LysR family transcriptional regulator [Pseudomonas gingeri]NWC35802.1 LysR family transcriptional regulator [Pseudomonas gingeri]NWD06318.1 LysR family transcriptional regulator [Pseudomonas gingeri]NWD49361.1 LysR family transcriptional regulator [Pseudomonas gingeri]NWE32843.1 LysR family transcriptional regulator [Pseudomonas gingeri]